LNTKLNKCLSCTSHLLEVFLVAICSPFSCFLKEESWLIRKTLSSVRETLNGETSSSTKMLHNQLQMNNVHTLQCSQTLYQFFINSLVIQFELHFMARLCTLKNRHWYIAKTQWLCLRASNCQIWPPKLSSTCLP
jgi:hypothetical protein